MTTTRRSHADCTHPSTSAARTACRKGTAPVEAIASEGIDYSAFSYDFERETCFRCSGTGTYPSAAWNGVCLGCNGQGKSLTRAGKAAKKAHDAWIADHLMIPVTDIRVGMKVRPTAIDGWKTVVSIEGTNVNGTQLIDGEHVPMTHLTFTTQKATWSLLIDGTVQRAATPEERTALMTHLDGRKGFVLTPR